MKNLFRKPKLSALPGPDDPLDGLALKAALAKLDAHYAELAEFRANIAGWQRAFDDYMADGDPMDLNRAISAGAMKTRLEIAPRQLARAEEKTPAFIEAVIVEVRAFETRILAAGQAEVARLDASIMPVVLPYCRGREAALRVARACTVYSYIPGGRQSLLLGTSIMESDSFWLLGHESYPFARVLDSTGGLARAEGQLRSRINDLFVAYDVWRGRGGQWVPKDFAVPSPLPEAVPAPEPEPASDAEAAAETETAASL